MPDFMLSAQMGIDTAHDELRLPEGYFRIIRGAYLRPDDPDRLWKLPGRTRAGGFLSATSVTGMDFLQQDLGDVFALWANDKVYSAPSAIANVDTWTEATDLSTPPVAFPQTGTAPKAIHDGNGRWVLWSGSESERPLIRDTNGTWRYLSVKKPSASTPLGLNATIASPGTDIIPDAIVDVTGSDAWDNKTNSYDTDQETYAYKTYPISPGTVSGIWTFSDAGTIPVGSTVQVILASSSLPPWGVDPPVPGSENPEAIEGTMTVELSQDAGGTWSTLLNKGIPVSGQTVNGNLTFGGNWTDIQIRITGSYTTGIVPMTFQVYEVFASSGSGTEIRSGTYYYATTEILLLDDGTTSVESDISNILKIVATPYISGTSGITPAEDVYGYILDLPGRGNLLTDGCDTGRLQRQIYRSTCTGTFPDLGLIATVPITDTTFVDVFSFDGDTLGSPVLPTYTEIDSLPQPIALLCPAIRDATLFKGSLVVIPANLTSGISWSQPGVVDHFPLPHNLSALPTERNDLLKAICTINDVILLFFRTRIVRIKDLPFYTDQSWDIRIADQDILSPSEGLAGGIQSYCTFNAESGRALVAWVSDSGIWMTDGSLNFERGLGCLKLSASINWSDTVDTSRLGETDLVFDPVEQIMWLLYFNPQGQRQALAFHLAKIHWATADVPKVTGPHDIPLNGHLVGEFNTALRLWGWEAIYNPELALYNVALYNERTGMIDEAHWYDPAGQIETYLESGWAYPQGPYGEFQIYKGALFHSNWGPNHTADIRLEFRRDDRGIVQNIRKGISLLGSRISSFWLSRSGRSLRVTLRHLGHAEGALGPLVFEGESLGPSEGA